ncbi:hypothetical protein T484DRAFT_3644727, partial [Baffinella frigidus]
GASSFKLDGVKYRGGNGSGGIIVIQTLTKSYPNIYNSSVFIGKSGFTNSYKLDVEGDAKITTITCPTFKIGTATKLQLYENLTVTAGTAFGYLNSSGNTARSTFSQNSISMKVTGAIWSTVQFLASSDQRIKKNIITIEDGESLDIINRINPCKYQYADEVKRGSREVIGFIAQEVKEVLPGAVTDENTEYIPSHYELVTIDGCTVTTTEIHEFIIGDKLKFYNTNNDELFYNVAEVKDDHTFIIDKTVTETELFCFGKQVSDFNVLDKQAIFTVNVSATQQLYRMVIEQQATIEEYKTQNDAFKVTIEELNVTIADYKADIDTALTNMSVLLARIEALESK